MDPSRSEQDSGEREDAVQPLHAVSSSLLWLNISRGSRILPSRRSAWWMEVCLPVTGGKSVLGFRCLRKEKKK